MQKKLYRSKSNQMIAGVCAGLAEYLNIDVSIVRIIWALITLTAGVGVLLYIVCAIVVPEKPDSDIVDAVHEEKDNTIIDAE